MLFNNCYYAFEFYPKLKSLFFKKNKWYIEEGSHSKIFELKEIIPIDPENKHLLLIP